MAELPVRCQKQKEQAGMVVPVDFSLSSEENVKDGLGRLKYQLASMENSLINAVLTQHR